MPSATVLFRTTTLTVIDVACGTGHQPMSAPEVERVFAAVFPRRGVFVYHFEDDRVVADPTIGFVINKGELHRTSHPTADGDRNTVISFPDDMAEGMLDTTGAFPRRFDRIGMGDHLRHQRMIAGIRRMDLTALEVDETCLDLVHALALGARAPRVEGNRRALISDAREYLASTYTSDVDLRTAARELGCSPHHLSRSFRAAVGCTLSRYRTELRLRHVLDRLAGHGDLATLAIEAGFFDHAHMTRTMRRHAGSTPSLLREQLTP